jgi:hypothetical protein
MASFGLDEHMKAMLDNRGQSQCRLSVLFWTQCLLSINRLVTLQFIIKVCTQYCIHYIILLRHSYYLIPMRLFIPDVYASYRCYVKPLEPSLDV